MSLTLVYSSFTEKQHLNIEIGGGVSSKCLNIFCGQLNGDIKKFNGYIENTLGTLEGCNRSIHIMGDLNINLLDTETCFLDI